MKRKPLRRSKNKLSRMQRMQLVILKKKSLHHQLQLLAHLLPWWLIILKLHLSSICIINLFTMVILSNNLLTIWSDNKTHLNIPPKVLLFRASNPLLNLPLLNQMVQLNLPLPSPMVQTDPLNSKF